MARKAIPLRHFLKNQPALSIVTRSGATEAASLDGASPTSSSSSSSSSISATDVAYGFDVADLATSRPLSEVPGPRRWPLLGTMYTFKPFPGGKVNFFESESRKWYVETYGNIVKTHIPLLPSLRTVVTLYDPEDFNIVFRNEGKYPSRVESPVFERYRDEQGQSYGLIFSNKEEWWRMRQPINKVMMRANAALPYLEFQTSIGDQFVDLIKKNRNQDTGLHETVMQDAYRWALESVSAVVFDQQMGCMDPDLPTDSWQQQFITAFQTANGLMLKLGVDPRELLMHKCGMRSKAWNRFFNSMKFLDDTTTRLITEAESRFRDSPPEENAKRFLPQLLSVESLSTKDKLTMIFDMMLAALDTTTYSLFRTLFLMAKNPETQDRLHEELMLHVGPPGSPITPTALSRSHYLKACVKESQRLMPLAPQNGRALPIDVVVKGYRIPAGTQLIVDHEIVSLSSQYFEDPSTYRPERWLRTDKRRGGSGGGGGSGGSDGNGINPFIVLPFGFGPRMCVGRRFAEQELWIGLMKIIHSFKVTHEGDKLGLKAPGLDKHPIKLDFTFRER